MGSEFSRFGCQLPLNFQFNQKFNQLFNRTFNHRFNHHRPPRYSISFPSRPTRTPSGAPSDHHTTIALPRMFSSGTAPQ